MRRFVVMWAFGLLLAFFFVYFAFSFENLWRGPQIAIDFPTDGVLLDGAEVAVSGHARVVANLELNGRPIYTDGDGNFEEKLILSPGLNIIELKAEGRFGSVKKEQRMVMIKLPE